MYPQSNTVVEAPFDFYDGNLSFSGRTLSAWHILTWQYLHTLLWKSSPNPSDCEGISCTHPLQVTTQIFSWIQMWDLARLFQNLKLVLVKPFFCGYECMFVSLLRWKVNFINFLADTWRFCTKIELYLEPFTIPFPYINIVIPATKERKLNQKEKLLCFTVVLELVWWCAGSVFHQTNL